MIAIGQVVTVQTVIGFRKQSERARVSRVVMQDPRQRVDRQTVLTRDQQGTSILNRILDIHGGAIHGDHRAHVARAGGTRADALRNLAERMGLDEVRSMVTLLLQSEELGTSVADALRLYADDMRTMRMLRAETKAQALPVKLALPLGFFIFPTMMIVILLPVIIRIYRLILQR